MAKSNSEFSSPPVIGYHKIRGLAGPLRMMCSYAEQPYTNKAYGGDMKDSWFKTDKPSLIKENSCINLPYIQAEDGIVTQSNTCLLYLGKKLKLDPSSESEFGDYIHNHTVLDQVMDLRNELMKIVYPFAGVVKSKEEFFGGEAEKYLTSTVKTHLTKLEGFFKDSSESSQFICGRSKPTSADFALFEMLDQHKQISEALGLQSFFTAHDFPKLFALWDFIRNKEPKLSGYFSKACYKEWAHNNGLYTFFTGQGEEFVYGGSVVETA